MADDSIEHVTGKPGPVPKFAKNQTDLGKYLIPPRDRKIIQLAMKREGCPGRTPDGRYEVFAWQQFIATHFASANLEAQPDKLKLELEKLRLTNAKLEWELRMKQKDFTANTEIEMLVGQAFMQAKRVLLAIPSKMAPILSGLSDVEIELRLKDEINACLAQLTACPLYKA